MIAENLNGCLEYNMTAVYIFCSISAFYNLKININLFYICYIYKIIKRVYFQIELIVLYFK